MIRLLLALIFVVAHTTAKANDAFIYYNSNTTGSQYSNIKSQLEDLGFTVTGSTSTSVSSNAVSGKELVIDISGTSNCGSTCRSVYDSYVSGGGKLLIAGTNSATNRNSSIEALIENKMSVGSFTQGGGCNTCYYSVARGDYASSTSSENTLPGSDKYMYNMSGGTPMTTNGSSSTISIWHKWDYGSNGGAVYVTFGYRQFLSTHTYASLTSGKFLLKTNSGRLTEVSSRECLLDSWVLRIHQRNIPDPIFPGPSAADRRHRGVIQFLVFFYTSAGHHQRSTGLTWCAPPVARMRERRRGGGGVK